MSKRKKYTKLSRAAYRYIIVFLLVKRYYHYRVGLRMQKIVLRASYFNFLQLYFIQLLRICIHPVQTCSFFFRHHFHNCLSCAHNCDVQSCLHFSVHLIKTFHICNNGFQASLNCATCMF